MEQRERLIDICDTCAWETAGCHSAHFHPNDRQVCSDYKSLLKEKAVKTEQNDAKRKAD